MLLEEGLYIESTKYGFAWKFDFKLKATGFSGNLLYLFKIFLENRYQRVLLNGQMSQSVPIKAHVPQISVLGLLLFLICINDVLENLSSKPNSLSMIHLFFQRYKIPISQQAK